MDPHQLIGVGHMFFFSKYSILFKIEFSTAFLLNLPFFFRVCLDIAYLLKIKNLWLKTLL